MMRAMHGRERLQRALFGVLLVVVGFSAAAEEKTDASSRWLPGFSAFSGAIIQEAEASALTSLPPDSTLLTKGTRVVFGYVGFSAELMTPSFALWNRNTRFFAHADVSLSFDDEVAIANEGAPGNPVVPDLGSRETTTTNPFTGVTTTTSTPIPVPVAGVQNKGRATKAQVEPLVVSGGLGVAIEVKAWGRDLRIKPSLEWMRHETAVTNALGYAASLDPPPPPPPGQNAPQAECPCETAYINISKTKSFHSLGPGLELELDAARAGSFLLSVYTSGQAYRVLGNREIEVLGVAALDGGSGSVSQLSTYELDPWQYRFAVGLRFRWMPE